MHTFYERQNMSKERVRFSIDLEEPGRDTLASVAKSVRLTQGEVVDTLLEMYCKPVSDELLAALRQRREDKVAARTPKKKFMESIRDLSPEQLEELERIIRQGKAA